MGNGMEKCENIGRLKAKERKKYGYTALCYYCTVQRYCLLLGEGWGNCYFLLDML